MRANNKIRIPWYRRNITVSIDEDEGIQPISIDFPDGARPTPVRQAQPVRQPATQPSLRPSLQPSLNPVLNPAPDIGENPFRMPGLAPLPIPLPIPGREQNQRFPSNNPAPVMSENQIDFITKIQMVSALSGIGAVKVYDFLSNYQYDGMKLSDFHSSAEKEFGIFAATVLSTLIVGKHIVGNWGKRLGFLVSPPILDDDLVKQYFKETDA